MYHLNESKSNLTEYVLNICHAIFTMPVPHDMEDIITAIDAVCEMHNVPRNIGPIDTESFNAHETAAENDEKWLIGFDECVNRLSVFTSKELFIGYMLKFYDFRKVI